MIAVFDTRPLNYLILIGYIDVLPKLFDEILIPRAVADELSHHEAPGRGSPIHFETTEMATNPQGNQARSCADLPWSRRTGSNCDRTYSPS